MYPLTREYRLLAVEMLRENKQMLRSYGEVFYLIEQNKTIVSYFS